ncbi:hypothetical protein ACFZAU_38200 [Streptomyces sp. NPDC008238]
MPRPSDWNVVGLHGDPTPGDPVQIRQLVTDLSTIGSQARFIATAIDQVMNTADSSVFAGQTADALRGKIDDRLRNHINDVANSFEEVSRTLGDWANWVEEAQGKADGALSAARGLPQDDPQLEVHRHTAESAGAELGEHGSTVAGVINKASDIRLPISDCQVFWEMFQILAIILIVPALIFGGPIALLAFGVNMTLFVKAAIDFARGDIGFLDLFLAGLGIIAPTTKALPIFSIGKLIKGGVTAGIQWGRGSILSLRDIISGFRFATVFTGLRDVARMSLTWVRQGGLWVMQNFHNLPALGGSVIVKNGLVVIQGVRSIPVVVRGWTTAVRAGAPGAWKNFQLFAQETWSSQMAGGKWTRLLLPVTHTDIAEYGLKGALRMGFWDRGVMGRGVWDLPVGGTAAHTASAVPIGPHGATPHFDVAHADINVARVDLADVRFGNFADTHTSIRPASFSVAPIDTVDLSGLRVGTLNPVSVHGATSLVDGSTAGFRAVRHMDDVVDIAGTQLSGMKIDAFGVTPGQMSEGLGVSAAAPGGHVTHSSGLYVPGSAGTPAVHEGVDITALAAHGNGSLLSQGTIGVLTAPPGGTNALHTALTGVPAPAPGTTAVHDLLAAPGAPGAGTGAAHTALTGVQAPPSGAGVHDLLTAPGGTTGAHGPLTGVPGHQSGTSAGGSAFDVLAGGSKGTPNNPVPTHFGSSLDDNVAGAARANQAHLTLDEIVRPAGGGRPGSVVTDTVPGPSAHGAPAPGAPKAGVHGIAPKDAARSAFDLLDDGRGARPVDGPAFAGAPGAGRTVDTDAGHAFAGAPAKSTDDVVVAPGTHDKVAVTGDGNVAVPLRQDPVPVRPSASGGGHVLSREADLLHEVNLKLGKMGSGTVTVEAVTAARQVLEDLRGAAFTKVDIRAQADQLAVHLAGPERGHLPGGVRDGDHTHDAPTPGGHHAPPAPPRPPRPASGLLDGLDDVLPDDTGAPLGSRFDFDDDSVPGSPVGEHGTEDLDGFSEFVDLIRPLRQHIERALDNPAADIEVALVASPGGRTWREFSDDVGHAMVSVMLPGERKPLTIGFYPEDGNLFGNPGAIVNDAEYLLSGHVRVLGTYRITAEQLFEAYRYAMANSGAVYDLFRYNCVRFAEGFVSAALGKSVADLWVAAPYRLVDTMLRRDGAWHWADGTSPVAKLTADDTIRYQNAFGEVEDWRLSDHVRFEGATDQAKHFVLFDHQRPLIDGNLATAPQKERLLILDQFEKMITHTILTSGEDAGRLLSRQLGEAYGTLRPGLSDLPGPSVTGSVTGDSLPGAGRGSVDSVPEPAPSPGGSSAGGSGAGDSAGHLPPQSPVQYASDVQHMFAEIDDMLQDMGLFRHSLDDLPSGPPSPVHPGAGGDVHVGTGAEPHTPAVDKGKGKAPADIAGSSGARPDHDGVRGDFGDDLSEIDAAAAITDARRDLINARAIRDDLQTRYVDGAGTSAEVDGVRYLESWEQVRQAEAALTQAEAHWDELTGGAPLPEVQSYAGHGLGGGAPRLPEGLRSLLHLKGRGDAVPPAPEGVVQSVDHVPSATHVVTPLEGGKLSHALVPSGQDLTVAHWLDDPQSAYGRPKGNGKEAYEGDLKAHQDVLTKGLAGAEHNDDLTRVLTQQQESFLENVALFHALEGRTELRDLSMPQLSAIVMAERRALRTLAADTDALTTKLRGGDWDWAKGYRLDGADAGELIAKVHRHLQDELSLTVNLKLGNQVPGGGTLLDAMTADQQLLRNAWEIDNAGAGYYVTRGNTEEALGLPASVKRTTDASGIYPGQGGKSFAPTAADLTDLPNYAALTSKYRPGGVKMYGQAVFHLKPNLMERATFTPADSFIEGVEGARSVTGRGNMLPLLNHGPEPLVRLAFAEATDFQFDDAFRGFRDAGTLERRLGRYFEAQLHGGVKWDDLDRVVLVDDGFDPALQARKLQLEQFAKDKGLSFTVEVHNARPGAASGSGVHPAPPAPPAAGGTHPGGTGAPGPSTAHGPGPASGHPGTPDTPPAPGGGKPGSAADELHENYADLRLAASLLDEGGVPRADLFTDTAARVERSSDASFVSPAAPAASGGTAKLTDDQILNVVVGTGGRNGDERRTLGGFEFGAGTRSNDGKNLVSRPVVVTVKDGGTEADVAVHLNVMLSSGNEADVTVTGGKLANTTEVTITGSKFHLTARPHTDQNLIDLHGPSSDTASKSIHVGPSNAKTGWNSRPGNTRNLAQSLGVSEQKLIEALDNRFPPSGLVETIHRFQDDVERAVVHGSGAEDVRVHFQGDKSFPVRGDSGGVSAPAVTGLSGGAGDVLHGAVPGAGRVDLTLDAGWDAARGAVAPNTVKHSWVDPVSTPRGGGAHAPRYEVRAGYDVRRFELGDRSVTDLTVRVRLAADGLSPSEVDALWDRAVSGVERVFNRPGAVLRDESVLHVTLERVTGNASDAHLTVNVGGSRGAMNQHQWRIDATEQDLAHELGHQLGLRDEYRDTTAGHRPEVDGSLMGNYHNAAPEGLSQGGLRPRYLDLIHGQVVSHDHVHVPHVGVDAVDGIAPLPRSVSPSAPSASTSTAAHAGAGTGGRLTPDAVRILDSITSSGTVDGSRRTLAGFEFGKVRDTGSTNLISRPVLMTVTEGDKAVQVAVHLNVMVTPSGRLDGTSVTLNASDFHLTARSKAAQDLIDKHGPSALTADNSIHVGPGNAKAGWDNRAGHLQNLADELGITRESLIKALDNRFPPGELPDTVALFQRDVERAVVHASSSEVITVEFRGDKSFPVQDKSAGVSARAVDGPAGVVDDFFHGAVPGAGRVDLTLDAEWDAARGAVAPNTVKHSWVDPVSTPRGGGAHAPRYEVRAGYDVRRFELGDHSVTDLTVRVRLAAEGLSPSEVDALWDRAVSGVERVFNRPGAVLRDESVLHVTLERVTGNASDAHLTVNVGGSRGAMNQHQWRIDATEQDLAHELGHQLGLRDEYRDTTAGHRPEVDGSLMGNYHNAAPEGLSQGGLRPRYLDLIHGQVASHDHVHVPHLPAASDDVIAPGGSGAAELDLLDPAVFKARTSGSGTAIDAVERRLAELYDVQGTDLAGRITALDELTAAADDFLTAHRGAPGAVGVERTLVQARAESGAYRLLQERAAFGTGHGGGVAALDDLATRVRAVLAGDDLTQATRVRLQDALTGTERQAGALRLLAGSDVPAAPAPAPAAAGRGADDVPWAEDYRRVEELLGREGDPRREGWADLTRARQDLGTAEDALPHGEASTSQGISTIEELLRSDTLAARDRVTSAIDGLREQGIDPHQVETRIRDVHEEAAVGRGATPGAGKLSDLPEGTGGSVTRVELSDSGVEGANGLVIERTAADDGSVTHRVLGRGLEPDEGRTVVFRDGGFDVRHTASDTVVRYNESGIRTAQEVPLRNAAGDPNGLRLHTDLNGHGRPAATRLTGPDAEHHLAEPLEDGTVRVTDTRTGETTRHRTGGHPVDGGLRLRGADGTPAEGDLVLVREDGTTRVTDVQGRDVPRMVTPLEDGAGFRITDDVSGASVRHDGAGRLQETGLSLTGADGGRGDLFLARDGAGTHTLTNAHGVPQRGDVTVLPGDAGFRIIDDGTGATSRYTPDGRRQDAGTALADPADGVRGARVAVADGAGGLRLTDGLGRPLTERVTDVGGGRLRTFDDTTGRSVLHDDQGRHVETGTALADPVAGTRGDRFVVPDAANGHRLTDATGAALPEGVQALPGNGGFRVTHATGYRTFAPDGAITGDGLRLTGRGGVPAGHLDRAAGGGQRWLDDAFAPDAQRAVTVHGNGHIEIARPGNGHQVFHGTTGELVQEVTPLPGGGRQVTAAHGSFARHDAADALTAHGTPLPDEAGGRVLVTRAPSADEPNGAHWLEDPAGNTIRHWDATTQPAGGVRIECTLPGGPRRGEFLELDPDGVVVRQGFNVLDKGRTAPYQYVLDHRSGTWARTGGPDGAPRGVFHHGTADLTGVANGRVVLLSATGAPVPVFERRVLPGGGLLDSFRRTDTIAFGRTNPRTSWARWGDEAALSGSGIREYDTAGTGWRDLDGRGDVVHEYQAGLQKHTNGTGHTLALRNRNGDLRWHRFDGAGKELAEGPRTPDRFDSGWTDLADDGRTVVQRKWGMGRLPEHAGQYEEHKIVQDAAAPGGWRTDGTWQRQSPHGKEVGRAEVVDGHLLVTERWREQRPPVWVRKAWLPGARNAEGGYAHVLGDNAHQLFTWQKRPIGTATGEVTSGVRYVGLDGGVLDLTADGRFARLTTKLHDGTTLKVGDHAGRPGHAPAAAGHQPWEAGQLRGYRVPQDPAATGLLWRDEFSDAAGVQVVREGLPGGVVREYTTPRAVDAAPGHGTWVTRDAHGNLTGMRQPNPDGTLNSFIEGVGKTDSARWTWREVDAEGTPLGASGTRTFFRGSSDPKLSWDDSFRDRDAGGRLVRERRMLDKGRYVQAWRDPADDNRWLTAAYDRTGRAIDPGPGRQVRSWWSGTSWQDQWSRGARHFRDELRPLPGTQGATVRLREVPVGLGGPLRVREYDPAAATPHSVWKEFDHESVVRERKAVRDADGTVSGYLETDAWRGQWNRYDADGALVAQRTDSGLVWERRGPFDQMRLVGNEYDYRGALTEIRGWGRRVREAQRMPWSGTVVPDGAGAALREARYEPYWRTVAYKAAVEFGQEFVLEFAANLVVNAIVDAAQHKKFNGDDVLKAFANAAVSSGVKTGLGIAVHENRIPGLRNLGNLKTTLANVDGGKHPQRRPFNHDKTWTNEWAGNETPTRWRGGIYDFAFSAGTSVISGWVNGAMNAAVWGVSDANGATVKLSGADAFLDGGINATAALTTSASTALVKNVVVLGGGSRLFHRQGFADFWIQLPFKIFEKSIQSVYLTGAYRASINPSWYQAPPAGTEQKQ